MKGFLHKTRNYLQEKLIPFWEARIVEPEYGGFQTNYDRNGKRTDVTDKALLTQVRCIFAIAHIRRMGFEWKGADEALRQGIDFLYKFFRDEIHDGYCWMVAKNGIVLDDNKIIYGHSFLIYALAEYALLSGDQSAADEAVRVFNLLQERVADIKSGGYYEHFDRVFNLKKARGDIVSHKSLDVHMHLMEAFTTLYELTRDEVHRRALTDTIELIFSRMVDPKTGTGIAMFTENWQPIANVELDTVWGRDRFDENGKSPEITSYGHNIELAWLYLHAQDILGITRSGSKNRVIPIFEHTYDRGIDWDFGGLYVEGYRDGDVTEVTKEFWQQAEAMVGFLDAYALTGDKKYLKAFQNIHDFVFTKMINWEQGEWFALLNRQGEVIWDYMGTHWKVCYHTLRGTCQVVKKLEQILK
jgi:mannobiose 2-epimerase